MRKPFRKTNFTLIETLIASTILVMVSIGIYGTVYSANQTMLTAKNHQAALNLATDETLKAFHLSLEKLATLSNIEPNELPQIPVSDSHQLYNYGGTLRTFVYDNDDYYTIKIIINWVQRGNAAQQEYSIDRYKMER